MVVELNGCGLVVAPGGVAACLRGLDLGELLDVGMLSARLTHYRPSPIGTASLAYRDSHAGASVGYDMARGDPVAVGRLQKRLAPDEWDESGLDAMPHRWAVITPVGRVAAVAGYEVWGDNIAHLGVAAHPLERGRGFATAATRTAMLAAIGGGLVAQWRCRVGNRDSERLAARLGFVSRGRQTAVALG